jgi:hypothetical protein
MLDFDEYIESLLEVLVSLRLFAFRVYGTSPIGDVLAFITNVPDRAPHLEYLAVLQKNCRYWKRIGGEWVICDETEFPSLVLECVCFRSSHNHFIDDT